MASVFSRPLPPLPLLLFECPPALEQMLAQEGISFHKVRDPHPLAFAVGRFVLFDSRKTSLARLRMLLDPRHTPLDVNALRLPFQPDPFTALLDTRPGMARWHVGGHSLAERVSLQPRAEIRRALVDRLRTAVVRSGGIWARLNAFPFPYRSAFNFRADLDEPVPEDYARFANARKPLADCTTHFVSTHAYGQDASVLADLAALDTQSHGHWHAVYRDFEANHENIARAHASLTEAGFDPVGFAAPGGQWNAGLDAALEAHGYEYSSDFQVGYDDLPFYPWLGSRQSAVLQVPIHPICEGLFFEAGARNSQAVSDHLVRVVRAKVQAGEPAFVYGHPERRLGRYPEVLTALAAEVRRHSLLWRVTLTEFARWWRWRAERKWSIVPRPEGRFEVQFDDWDDRYPLGLEIIRGSHSALVPLDRPRTQLCLDHLAFERRRWRVDLPAATAIRGPRGLKTAVRDALYWETATPIDELPVRTWPDRLKKRLRRWRAMKTQIGAEETMAASCERCA